MKYILLIHEPKDAYKDEGGPERLQDMVSQHMALSSELRASGVQLDGAGFQPAHTAVTMSLEGGETTLRNGPVEDGAIAICGYYLIDVPSMQEAVVIAERVPKIEGGKIEVRPLMGHD